MAAQTLIQFLRGVYANLLTGQAGRPEWATDALRLYIDDGSALRKIGPGAVASGHTLPAVNLTAGDLFIHNPTDRVYLMQYDGSAWCPLASLAATTVYVNGGSGSDTQNKGFGTGSDAYATIQYAVDQLPAVLLGNVTINIASGTYRETVTIQGKNFAGAYSITLTGAETTDLSATSFDSAANGGGNGSAGYGTITKTAAGWTVNAYRDKWIAVEGSGTGAGQVYVVHSNTADTITVVGPWATVPGTASNTLRVWSNGTRITGANAGAETTPVRQWAIRIKGGQRGIILTKLKIDYAGLGTNREAPLFVAEGSAADVSYCWLEGGNFWSAQITDASKCSFEYCVSKSAVVATYYAEYGATISWIRFCRSSADAVGVLAAHAATVFELRATYIGSATSVGVAVQDRAGVATDAYLEIDAAAGDGMQVSYNGTSRANVGFGASTTSRLLNNGGWGFNANDGTGGVGLGASGYTYSGNASGTYTPVTGTAGGTT